MFQNSILVLFLNKVLFKIGIIIIVNKAVNYEYEEESVDHR